jgi:hypothetical protein
VYLNIVTSSDLNIIICQHPIWKEMGALMEADISAEVFKHGNK